MELIITTKAFIVLKRGLKFSVLKVVESYSEVTCLMDVSHSSFDHSTVLKRMTSGTIRSTGRSVVIKYFYFPLACTHSNVE